MMKNYAEVIKTIPLFHGISESNYESVISCLDGRIIKYKKGETILLAGDRPEYVGAVLEGQLHILREDIDGIRSVIAALTPGELFAEALCCAAVDESPVSVVADSSAYILLLKFDRILHWPSDSCEFHSILVGNMMKVLAQKNLFLQSRMELLGIKSIREKVLCYLNSFVPQQGNTISIPFNREELAAYLGIDRSALSHELSRMKADGLIEYKKNVFIIK